MMGARQAVGGLVLGALVACASPVREQAWHEVSSERFRVVSNLEREEAEQALELRPGNAHAHALLADAHKFTGVWESAEQGFRRALELAPGSTTIRLDWGEYLLDRSAETPELGARRRLLEEARATFRGVLEEDARNPEAWTVLAHTYLIPGEDPALAIGPAERAFALLPSSPSVKETRASAFLLNGRRADAERALQGWLGLRHTSQSRDDVRASLDAYLAQRRALAEKLGVTSP